MTVRRMWVLVAAVVVATAVASPGAGAAGDSVVSSEFALPVEVSGANPVRFMVDPAAASIGYNDLAGGEFVAGLRADPAGPRVTSIGMRLGPDGWRQVTEVFHSESSGRLPNGTALTDGETAVLGADPMVIVERTPSGWEVVDTLEVPGLFTGFAAVPNQAVIDGDTMVIGAPGASGRVFVYRRQPDRTWDMTQIITSDLSVQGVGWSVALVDGVLAVGVGNADDFPRGYGVAIFEDSPAGFVLVQELRPSHPIWFGQFVALLPDPAGGLRLLAAGHPEFEVTDVFEFRRGPDGFGAPNLIVREAGTRCCLLQGFSADGDRLALGFRSEDPGEVVVYRDPDGLGWTRERVLYADPPSLDPDDGFGFYVDIDDDRIAVQADDYVTTTEYPGRGAVFVFDLDPDRPQCAGLPATIVGTDGDDHLVGTPGVDVVWAGPGDDVVEGLAGDDVVCAGAGDDVVYGGAGDDVVYGQPGDDRIFGGDGHDDLRGEAGDDRVAGGAGDDVITGGAGIDQLFGLAGDDMLVGNGSNDTLAGGDGVDVLRGSWGDDVLDGGPGADTVDGGPAADVCAPDPADTRTRCEA